MNRRSKTRLAVISFSVFTCVAVIFTWLTWPALPVVFSTVIELAARQTAIFIGFVGTSVAAFSVWLAVRIVNRRERWAKWTAAGILAVFVAYPLSVGPAMWLNHRMGELQFVYVIYEPLFWVAEHGPSELGSMFMGYLSIFVKLPHS